MKGFKFKSGRELYANEGIFGIDGNGNISGGYDNGIQVEDEYRDPQLTTQDWVELADEMIARWTAFKLMVQAK